MGEQTPHADVLEAVTSRGERRGLRVLEFCDYYGPRGMGGAERVAREVNQRLVEHGTELLVLSVVAGGAHADRGVPVARRDPVDLSSALGGQLSVSPGYLGWAAEQAVAYRPDILYAHSLHFHGSLVAARISRRWRIPLVTVVHVGALDALRGRARALAEIYEHTAGRFILRQSRGVLAVSHAVARHAEQLGARRDAISVVANGVDHGRFIPTVPPARAVTVVFVGRLIANKGPELLMDAARALRLRGTTVSVVFVGDGPLRGRLERRARELGDVVVFAGASDDVASWLQRAHIVVRPSYTEGMPLTVLEAMASRRCIVVSDIPAHREILEHGRTALFHRVGDAGDLAATIETATREPQLRERLSHAAHRASLAYTWEATATQHSRVLRRAALVAARRTTLATGATST
jgi:glycosyltransferase involved in cell wall biosynthesis